MPLSFDALSGVYTFGVPALHDMPSLYLDRDTGAQIIEAANAGKHATLRLIAHTEEAEAYQLFGYLPGKDYGKPNDQQIMLITHTDGPSISQENGALGILAVAKYFSHIPQAERPRTLMLFYDCRHYMPGAERAFAKQDYAASHPDIYKKVIAAMGIEHLGQIQVAEGNGKPYHKTSLHGNVVGLDHRQPAPGRHRDQSGEGQPSAARSSPVPRAAKGFTAASKVPGTGWAESRGASVCPARPPWDR